MMPVLASPSYPPSSVTYQPFIDWLHYVLEPVLMWALIGAPIGVVVYVTAASLWYGQPIALLSAGGGFTPVAKAGIVGGIATVVGAVDVACLLFFVYFLRRAPGGSQV